MLESMKSQKVGHALVIEIYKASTEKKRELGSQARKISLLEGK